MKSRLIAFNELSRGNRRQNLAHGVSPVKGKARATCPSGNEMPAVVKVRVQVLGVGEHLTEKYNSEVIFPIKSQLQSVTIMHRNDWEGV